MNNISVYRTTDLARTRSMRCLESSLDGVDLTMAAKKKVKVVDWVYTFWTRRWFFGSLVCVLAYLETNSKERKSHANRRQM
jgi:hypothetical protein